MNTPYWEITSRSMEVATTPCMLTASCLTSASDPIFMSACFLSTHVLPPCIGFLNRYGSLPLLQIHQEAAGSSGSALMVCAEKLNCVCLYADTLNRVFLRADRIELVGTYYESGSRGSGSFLVALK